MLKTHSPVPAEQHFILSTFAPGTTQKWLALAVVCGIVAVFVSITVGPLRGVHSERVDAFVPAYATAMLKRYAVSLTGCSMVSRDA